MASTKERIQYVGKLLSKGQYAYLGRLVKRKLGLVESIKPAPRAGRTSVFHREKKQTIESFLGFAEGGGLPRWPTEVFLEVSNVCDLQCAMCPTFSALNPKRFNNLSSRHRGFFKFDIVEEQMAEVLKHALVVHAFGYGEPTIHRKFKELLDILAKYEVMVDFFTHGMHLTEEMCRDLVEKRISKITISFSGSNKDDYENVYLGGDFERVVGGIKRLNQQKKQHKTRFPLIEINSLGFKHHVDRLPEFIRMMGEAGANVINLKPLQTYDLIEELHGHASVAHATREGKILEEAQQVASDYGIRLLSREYEGIMSTAEDAEVLQSRHKGKEELSTQVIPITQLREAARKKRETEGGLGEKAASKMEIQVPDKEDVGYTQHEKVYCMEPFKTLYFNYEGAAYPCCFKSDKSVWGDLKQASAVEIWQSGLMQSMRSNVIDQKYPTTLCQWCIKAGTYPKNHGIRMRMKQYSEWYADRYKYPFFPNLQKRVGALPDNEEIFEQLAKTRK